MVKGQLIAVFSDELDLKLLLEDAKLHPDEQIHPLDVSCRGNLCFPLKVRVESLVFYSKLPLTEISKSAHDGYLCWCHY